MIPMQKNLYHNEIKNYLVELIHQNQDKPNFKLPSENQLAKKFDTSRLTVKNALEILVNMGLVKRYQGKGSFANMEKIKGNTLQDYAVCLVMPNVITRFIQEIIAGATDYFDKSCVNCLIYRTGNSQEREENLIGRLNQYNISGIIIYPASGEMFNKSLLKLSLDNFPIVSVDRSLFDLGISCVLTDHYRMMRSHTELLIKEGHRDIVFIHPESNAQSTQQRISGYQDALIEAKIMPNQAYKIILPYEFFESYDKTLLSSLKEKFRVFFAQNPSVTAVISTNCYSGIALMEVLVELKRKVELIFIDDDFPSLKGFMPMPYRSIVQDGYTMGKAAAELLLEQINGIRTETKIIYIPTVDESKR